MQRFTPQTIRFVRETVLATAIATVLAAIHYAAYLLRFEGQPDAFHLETLRRTLLPFVFLKTGACVWFSVHRGWRRFATFHDLVAIAEATSVGTLLNVLADHFWLVDRSVPRGVVIIDWGATLIVVCGLRSISRSIHERYRHMFTRHTKLRRALIVGTDTAGEAILRATKIGGCGLFDVVGFVDHDGRSVGETVGGVPVVGQFDQLSELVRRHAADDVLLTSGDLSGAQVRKVIDDCCASSTRVSMLPSYEQLLSGQVAVKARDVSIDDLLRREPVKLDDAQIHHWLKGRTLMVTGSAGSIGSEICRQLLQFGPARLVLVDRWENGQFAIEKQLRELAPHLPIEVRIADIADADRMMQLFAEQRPDILFHAAAYKHVPMMEHNPGEAVKNNVLATKRLADMADEFGLQAFVLISTDKAVNPTSVMGACKRVAELYIESLAEKSDCRFVTVRFGNVLDSAGSVVPTFREQIARGGPITVTDPEMTRFFMTIPEAAQLVIQAGAMGHGGEIFVLEMGEPVKIVGLAHDMIRLSGLRVGHDIDIEFIGLRPGEKLFEELHVHGETHQPTHHPKIHVALHTSNLAAGKLVEGIQRLSIVINEPREEIVDQLRRLIPEFVPEDFTSRRPRLFEPACDPNSDLTQPRAA